MLGHLHAKNNYCMYMTIKLSQLMLNLYVLSHAESFSRHTVDMHSLCEYYNLYEPQDGRLHKKQTNIRTTDVMGSRELLHNK